MSDAGGFGGWSRSGAGGRSCGPGASAGVFKVEKQGSRESQAHMLWLTLRQEVDWRDDFMSQFLSAGDMNSEIASGQRRNKCFVFFKVNLLTVFPTVWSQGHHSGCYTVCQNCLSARHNLGTAVVPGLPSQC